MDNCGGAFDPRIARDAALRGCLLLLGAGIEHNVFALGSGLGPMVVGTLAVPHICGRKKIPLGGQDDLR